MTDEPRYTLDEAARELDRRKCHLEGHNFEVVSTGVQIQGGGDDPSHVACERCGTRWTVGPAHEETR